MKKLSASALRGAYTMAALLLPAAAIAVAIVVYRLPEAEMKQYRLVYDIAVNIGATGLTLLLTFLFLSQANTVQITDSIASAMSDPDMPISRSLRHLLREVLVSTDRRNNIEVFRDHDHAYEALIDDIDDGDVFMVNTVFVTDDPDGKYKTSLAIRKHWTEAIKTRLEEKAAKGHGRSFTLYILEAPSGGGREFVGAIGGLEALRARGGRLYSLDIDSSHSKFMANYVLIKRTDHEVTRYIVYLGWFARGPGNPDYPSPCARVESEHLYKFLQNSYSNGLSAAAKVSE
jgi:hypothetical protein